MVVQHFHDRSENISIPEQTNPSVFIAIFGCKESVVRKMIISDTATLENEVYYIGQAPKSGMHLLYAGYVVYRGDRGIERHTHGHYEICLFTEGIVDVSVGKEIYSVSAGDLLITKPGDLHSVNSLGIQWGKVYIGVNGIIADDLGSIFRSCRRSVFSNALVLEGLFRNIIAETKDRQFGMAVAVEGILSQLMVAAARIIQPNKRSDEKPLPEPVALARIYLEGHPYHDVSLEDVATFSCLSKSRLSCVFSQEVGMSLRDYLRYVIMQRALRLLEDDQKSISNIADELRYPSVQYFSTVFHKFWGYTPREYRNSCRRHIPYIDRPDRGR